MGRSGERLNRSDGKYKRGAFAAFRPSPREKFAPQYTPSPPNTPMGRSYSSTSTVTLMSSPNERQFETPGTTTPSPGEEGVDGCIISRHLSFSRQNMQPSRNNSGVSSSSLSSQSVEE